MTLHNLKALPRTGAGESYFLSVTGSLQKSMHVKTCLLLFIHYSFCRDVQDNKCRQVPLMIKVTLCVSDLSPERRSGLQLPLLEAALNVLFKPVVFNLFPRDSYFHHTLFPSPTQHSTNQVLGD